jgi:hypothetical protein
MKEPLSSFGLGFGARVLALAFVLIALCGPHTAAPQAATPLSADEAAAIATDAYVYGYPLVTMEYTRRVLTNAAEAGAGALKAPMGQFGEVTDLPDCRFSRRYCSKRRYPLYDRVDRR